MEKRSFTVIFDVFQTVVSLDRLRHAMMSRGLPSHALMLFFDRMLHDAFALNISGVAYKPFLEVASAALVVTFRIQGQCISQDEAKALLKEECSQLDATDDVLPAVRMLSAAGIEMYAFSNGSKENTEKLLKRNNLDTFFKGVISIDDVQAWKPDRRAYEHAARTVGKAPQDCVLFSCHAWDICGAQQAGMVGAYVTRLEMVYNPALPPPSLSGESLFDVARDLILRARAHQAVYGRRIPLRASELQKVCQALATQRLARRTPVDRK